MFDGRKGYKGKQGFVGAIQQRQGEKYLLREMIQRNNIDLYLEIGTLWGGTAIIAALAGAKKVITIDSMEGLRWSTPDPWYPHEPITKERIISNFHAFGVEHVIDLIQAKSHPFPFKNIYPDITMIDGDHETETINDWHNVKDITKHAILIHDYGNDKLPLINHLVDTVIKEEANWQLKTRINCTAVIERIN